MPAPSDINKRKHMFSDDMKFLQKAVVYHPDGQHFLALKRTADDPRRPNCWDLPGGNVAFGEKHDESIIREITEETSLKIDSLLPIQIATNFQDRIYYLFIGYSCRAHSSEVEISSEHSEYRWVTTKEFLLLESADFLVDLVNQLDS